MSNVDALHVICLSLRSQSLRTRSLVLEILGAVCLIPGGHKRILETMSRFSKIAGEKARFETVISCLNADIMFKGNNSNLANILNIRHAAEDKHERITDLQVSSLSFINAIICAGAGKETEFRLNIRYEFIQLGINHIIDRLLSSDMSDVLDTQIGVFQSNQDADEQELQKRYEGQVLPEDPESIFQTLNNGMKNTRAYPFFLELLHTSLIIPANPVKRSKYWNIIVELVKQVVLQKDGENPDPDYSKLSINVQNLLTSLVDAEKVKDAEEKVKKQTERITKALKELDVQKESFQKEISKLQTTIEEKNQKEGQLAAELLLHRRELNKLQTLLKDRFGYTDPNPLKQNSEISSNFTLIATDKLEIIEQKVLRLLLI
jgi:hypothetical protein